MTCIRCRLDLAALSAVLSCATLVAQQAPVPDGMQPASQPASSAATLHVSSRLVVLDVVVEDAKGNIISSLQREDFHVTEAGKPQNILTFDTNGAHTPPPSVVIHSTQELDQLAPQAPVNIILLDEFNTRFEDMAFARYSLKKYLAAAGQLDVPTMLLAVSLGKFEVLHDYTQDKDEILSALEHHLSSAPWQVHQGGWMGER